MDQGYAGSITQSSIKPTVTFCTNFICRTHPVNVTPKLSWLANTHGTLMHTFFSHYTQKDCSYTNCKWQTLKSLHRFVKILFKCSFPSLDSSCLNGLLQSIWLSLLFGSLWKENPNFFLNHVAQSVVQQIWTTTPLWTRFCLCSGTSQTVTEPSVFLPLSTLV